MLHAGLRPDRAFAPSQLQADEMFEEQPSLVIERSVERPSQDGVSNAEIEEQHLRMSEETRSVGSAPRRDSKEEERVLEHVEIASGGLITHGGVARQRVQIDDAAGRCSGQVEKPGVTADVAHERLGL